jgi:hypothetical protein
MRVRSTAAAAVLTATVWLTLPGTASAVDLDCADFPNQAAAQVVLTGDPTDPNDLDADEDGQACENYGYTSVASVPGQVSARPAGGVAAGGGSAAGAPAETPGSPLPYVLGGVAFAAAGGAALAARRATRA